MLNFNKSEDRNFVSKLNGCQMLPLNKLILHAFDLHLDLFHTIINIFPPKCRLLYLCPSKTINPSKFLAFIAGIAKKVTSDLVLGGFKIDDLALNFIYKEFKHLNNSITFKSCNIEVDEEFKIDLQGVMFKELGFK